MTHQGAFYLLELQRLFSPTKDDIKGFFGVLLYVHFLCCYCCLIALYNLLARACEITEHTQARLVIKAENTGQQRRESSATLDIKAYFPQGPHLHKDVHCL